MRIFWTYVTAVFQGLSPIVIYGEKSLCAFPLQRCLGFVKTLYFLQIFDCKYKLHENAKLQIDSTTYVVVPCPIGEGVQYALKQSCFMLIMTRPSKIWTKIFLLLDVFFVIRCWNTKNHVTFSADLNMCIQWFKLSTNIWYDMTAWATATLGFPACFQAEHLKWRSHLSLQPLCLLVRCYISSSPSGY